MGVRGGGPSKFPAGLAATLIVLFFMVVGAATGSLVTAQAYGLGDRAAKDDPPKEQPVRPRPLPAPSGEKPAEDKGKAEIPEEGVIYAWPVPEKGLQTVLVIKTVDGDTVHAAYLVPFTVRVWGVDAPEMNTPEGKKSAELLSTLLAGRLGGASLHGKDKYGRTLADFWLGPADPKDKTAPSGWLSDWMVSQGAAVRYNGGPRAPAGFKP